MENNKKVNKKTTKDSKKKTAPVKKVVDKSLELQQTINNLTNLLVERQAQIDNLRVELNKLNDDYKQQMLLKSQQANLQISQLKTENDAKFKKELDYAKKYAIEDQALAIVDIINQFELALSYQPKNPEVLNYQKGFKIFLTMLNNLIAQLNIQIIKPELGKEFDPNLMECLETVTLPNYKDNDIAQIISNGYKLYDHVLKPAIVKVNKI